jgi:hypothetical protein
VTTYQIKMASGDTFTWQGDTMAVVSLGTSGLLPLAGGTLINLAHVESMIPIGTTEPEVESP